MAITFDGQNDRVTTSSQALNLPTTVTSNTTFTGSATFTGNTTFSNLNTTLNNLNVTSINNSSVSGLRNKIINGNFVFWERGTPLSQTANWTNAAAASFIADRWFSTQFGNGVNLETVSRIADSENANAFACRIQQSTTDPGNSRLCQIIEPIYTRDLVGRTCTLSFKHACGTGVPFNVPWSVAVNYDTLDGTINSGAASGTAFESLGTNAATLQFRSASDASTSYTRSTLTFSLPSTAKRVSVVFYALNNNTVSPPCVLDLKEVQLEAGSVATSFESRPDDLEARLCHRYYQRHEILGNSYPAQFSGSSFWGAPVPLFCPMRTAPTNIGYNNLGGTNYWVYAGVTPYSANSLTGLQALATTTYWRLVHARQVGGSVPSNGFYLVWEPTFYLRLDSEL